MNRSVVIVAIVGAVLVSAALPVAAASNYLHLDATDNVGLSVQWSEEIFDPVSPFGTMTDSAIIVRDDAYTDALAAGALGGTTSSPVLLNPRAGGLHADVEAELDRLGIERVWIVGGTAAVSAATESDLVALGYDVQRLAGSNRYASSAAVFTDATDIDGEAVYTPGTSPFGDPTGRIYLARASDTVSPFGVVVPSFADALGAGMLAGTEGAPLLVTPSDSLAPAVRAALEAAEGFDSVVIVGGTSAVSTLVENEVRDLGFDVTRLAGPTRFDTAALVATESLQSDRRFVAIVDGYDTNSWVSGFAAAASAGGAVLLTQADTIPTPTDLFLSRNTDLRVVCAPEVPSAVCIEADAIANP